VAERPPRADARRNREKVLRAAQEAFAASVGKGQEGVALGDGAEDGQAARPGVRGQRVDVADGGPQKWSSQPGVQRGSKKPRPSTWSNHVRYVVSLRAPLSRLETSLQRPSAVSSIEGSTPPAELLIEERTRAEHSSVRAGSQHGFESCQSGQKPWNLQVKPLSPHQHPQVGTVLSNVATLASVRPACTPRFGGRL